jgi:hypothetical protein
MNGRNLIGALLIVLGCLSLGYEGIRYTRREKVLQIGSLVATADRQEVLWFPPWAGGVLLLGGIAVLMVRRDA